LIEANALPLSQTAMITCYDNMLTVLSRIFICHISHNNELKYELTGHGISLLATD